MAKSNCLVPFTYDDEPFFKAYDTLHRLWAKRKSQRSLSASLRISKNTLKNWEDNFVAHGALGLLAQLSFIKVAPQLEKLIILIKSARRHEAASLALKLSDALAIPGASLELIRAVQRCYGYGQRMDQTDISYYQKSDSHYWHHGWRIMPYQDSGINVNSTAEKNTGGRSWYQKFAN